MMHTGPFKDTEAQVQTGKMLSVPHMIVVFLVVLVVFGPQKLPELARSFGKLMAEFRKASNDFKNAFEEEMRDLERQARIAELKKQVAEANAAAAAATNIASQPAGSTLASTQGTPSAPEGGAAPIAEPVTPATPAEPVAPIINPVAEAVPRADSPNGDAAPKPTETPSEPSPSHDQQQPA
jgi:TatA/E family protein of Tat protein translocase